MTWQPFVAGGLVPHARPCGDPLWRAPWSAGGQAQGIDLCVLVPHFIIAFNAMISMKSIQGYTPPVITKN